MNDSSRESASLDEIVDKITSICKPVSIFLYGSRARADFEENSDHEIGVLYRRAQEISRTELKSLFPGEGIHAYPFEYEDLLDLKIDIPFPEAIYLRELILAGRTIYGEKVIERLTPPPILASDLMERIRFDTAFALAAVLSQRNGDKTTAAMEFSKSCLFAARTLVMLRSGIFPLTYTDIVETASSLGLDPEHSLLLKRALEVRKGADVEEAELYRNISFINRTIKGEVMEALRASGNKVVLE